MPPPRSTAGQASTDYVALLAVVGVVLAGAAAVGAGPAIGGSVAAAIRHAICRVAGGVCTAGEARAAELSPCVVHARSDRERLGAKVLVVRLGRGDAFVVEQRSDGTASVSFTDGGRAGLGVGVGLALPVGPTALLAGGAGVQFTAGRTWEFASFASAARFVRRWAREETLTGEARGVLRRACLWCGERARPRPPDATFVEGGGFGEFAADVRLGPGVRAGADAEAGVIAGRRVSGRRTTWYLRIDAAVAARLGAIIGAVQASQAREAALEVTRAGERTVELRVRAAASIHAGLSLPGVTSGLRELADGRGGAVEAQVALDLTDERNRRAAEGVLRILRPGVSPLEYDDRLRALAERLDADGAVDLSAYRVRANRRDLEAEAALGMQAGAGYERAGETRELVRAWSRRAGRPLREREDCVSA